MGSNRLWQLAQSGLRRCCSARSLALAVAGISASLSFTPGGGGGTS